MLVSNYQVKPPALPVRIHKALPFRRLVCDGRFRIVQMTSCIAIAPAGRRNKAQGGVAATKTNNEDGDVQTFEPYLASRQADLNVSIRPSHCRLPECGTAAPAVLRPYNFY